jgi:DNA-binding MarR family transcriptional regulator
MGLNDELVAPARAIAFVSRRLERALGHTDMTLPQFRVLALVASSGERAGRIAEKAAVSRPSLTGLLDGLEARGWVRRIAVSGDRRGVLLEVTDAGTEALEAAEQAMAAALAELLDPAPATQRRQALQGLGALGDIARARQGARIQAEPAAAPVAPTAGAR